MLNLTSAKLVFVVALFAVLPIAMTSGQQAATVVDAVDWQEMLGECDLVWDRLPTSWDQAPFLGNGEQGTLMYRLNDKTLQWDVGCSAAHDHRPVDDDDLSEKHMEVLNRGRHFIGHLELRLPTKVTSGQSRLSLFNAEATGTLESTSGKLEWRTIVHATEPVMCFEWKASGDLEAAEFVFVPEKARSPRAVRAKTLRTPANPDPVLNTHKDGAKTSVHNLHAGGQTAVAYFQNNERGSNTLWLSVKHSYPAFDAEADALKAVRDAASSNSKQWIKTHRDWWHEYYQASFVSIGDPFWDTFYWVQQYKLACLTRDKGWIIDNQGPWLQPTAWNATWWNLNVQVSHAGIYKANRRQMGSALSHRLDVNRDSLARNVAPQYRSDSYAIGRTASGWDLLAHAGEPGGRKPMEKNSGKETGHLLWALHNVDLEVRYWQDMELRDRVLYPLLVRAVNYYRHFLKEGPDGRLHLPITHSPEFRSAEDCSYDLDLLRWGAGRLLEIAAEKKLTARKEKLIPVWQDIFDRLVPTHVDETGIMIGKNAQLNRGHRHWSHLLAIYPLRTLTPDNEEDRELIDRSLKRWQSFGKGIAGYAFTAASCMSSILGDGDQSLVYLNGLKSYLKPSTMYSEIRLPVMETPLHGATAIQEMLFQSWGGRLRVFPAVPKAWPDVQFSHLRAEGAFLVSARREKGLTKWVSVEAEVGGTVEVDPQIADAQWKASPKCKVKDLGEGIFQIKSEAGASVTIWPAGEQLPKLRVEAIPVRGQRHQFGLPSRKRN